MFTLVGTRSLNYACLCSFIVIIYLHLLNLLSLIGYEGGYRISRNGPLIISFEGKVKKLLSNVYIAW